MTRERFRLAFTTRKRRLQVLAATMLKGAGIGAALHLILFLLAILQYTGAEYMGMRDPMMEERLSAMFQDTVIVLQLKILFLHMMTGAIVGAVWTGWLDMFQAATGVATAGLLRAGFVAALVLDTHIWFIWYAMTRYPALFVDRFYNSGPWLSWFQVIPSEWLPLWIYRLLASLFVLSVPLLAGLALLRRAGPGARRLRLGVVGMTVLLALAALWLLWVPRSDESRFRFSGNSEVRNVLVLGVDSVRPDFLERTSGDGFSALLARSVTFEQACTVFPRTFPALVTLVSGQRPQTHGVRHMFPRPAVMEQRFKTLPDMLRQQGWDTAVFSDFAGDIFGRSDLGFDRVEVPEFTLRSNVKLACWKMHVHLLPYMVATGALARLPEFGVSERFADPENLTDRFFDWLAERDAGRPFFSVLFYSAPHFPYASPYPFYRDRAVDGYSGPHRFCKVGMGSASQKHDEAEVEQIRANYLAGMDAVDVQVERILSLLSTRGLLDNTYIILTSDHGENLFEHGRGNSHGELLNGPESTRIPMVFFEPGRTRRLPVDATVSNLDIAPTIAGLLGVQPPEWMEGIDLSSGGSWSPPADRPVFAETGLLFIDPETRLLEDRSIRFAQLFDMFMVEPFTTELYLNPKYELDARLAKHRMILEDGFKLLYVPTRQGAKFECYDIRSDPDELRDIYSDSHETCARLKEKLLAFMESTGDGKRQGDVVIPQ